MNVEPWSPEAFEVRYRRDEDPWQFRTSTYEQARYRSVVSCLARPRYRSCFEPGCSVGELTWLLAPRCERLRAVDVSSTAVDAARARCAELEGVDIAVGSILDDPTTGHDLVVMSEIGYYFSSSQLDGVLDRLVAAMVPGADLVACHWTGHSKDHLLSGHHVHQRIAAHDDLALVSEQDHDGFVLGSWVRS